MTFAPTSFIKEAWEIFKRRPWFFIGSTALFLFLSYLPGMLLESFIPQPGENATAAEVLAYFQSSWPFNLLVWAVGIYLGVLALEFGIRAHDNPDHVQLSATSSIRTVVHYFLAQLLVGIIVVLGFILLIVPGIIASLALFLTSYYVIDRKMGPVNAIKASMAATKGYRWKILQFSLLCGLVNILGLLVFVVGLLVSIPVTLIAMVAVYRKLSAHR